MPRKPSSRPPKKTEAVQARRREKTRRNGGPESCLIGEDSPDYRIQPPRFIDLFCGIGGFRIAFEGAGGRCVFSSDYDKFSQQTYEANFGERPHGDIHTIAVADIPAHDILCAGFPCQPFSIAGVSKKLSLGRKHGFEDVKQGNLFFEIANILDFHRPAAFVLENVKNLKGHDGGKTFDIILRTLTDALGYTVYHKIIDAQSVVPQHRERIFLVGFREWRYFDFPQFPAVGPKLGSILESSPLPKYTLTDHLWNYLQRYAEKHQAAGNGFGFGQRFAGSSTERKESASAAKDVLSVEGEKFGLRRQTFVRDDKRLALECGEALLERRVRDRCPQFLSQDQSQIVVEGHEPAIECAVMQSRKTNPVLRIQPFRRMRVPRQNVTCHQQRPKRNAGHAAAAVESVQHHLLKKLLAASRHNLSATLRRPARRLRRFAPQHADALHYFDLIGGNCVK